MSDWRLLITGPAPGAWNMAVDEAILEHVGRRETLPTLRLFAWEPPCLSLGHAQPFADVDLRRLRERGWDVVRRPTGGRAILHTDELTYSVIASAEESAVQGTLLESYNRLATGLLHAVRQLGLAADMKTGPRPVADSSNPVCFEAPRHMRSPSEARNSLALHRPVAGRVSCNMGLCPFAEIFAGSQRSWYSMGRQGGRLPRSVWVRAPQQLNRSWVGSWTGRRLPRPSGRDLNLSSECPSRRCHSQKENVVGQRLWYTKNMQMLRGLNGSDCRERNGL